MGAFLIMLYLDTLGIFKRPHVLLVFAYWILLTVLLYKRRNKKVNPPGNRRPSRFSHIVNEKNKPAISEINPEKYLQQADHCPYCAVGVTSRRGENHCQNCNVTYTVTESNRISDNTRPLIDIFHTLFFVFAITCHTVFFVIFWEIGFNIVFNNNSLFLLMLPWVIHYLLFLYIAFRYGFINSPGSFKFNQREGDIIKVRYTEKRKHFLVHIILYSIAKLVYLVIVFMILTGVCNKLSYFGIR